MIFKVTEIENKIGYTFKDKMLLRKCFTHASYANEHLEEDNEVLEFFGDSIIEFIVTEYLYKHVNGDEGNLTEKRKNMVSNANLLLTVKKLGLHKYVLLGKGQGKSHNVDEKLYSSIYETLVAGIYLDGGLLQAKSFVNKTIIADFKINEKIKKSDDKTAQAKSDLQEYVQKKKLGSISYEVLSRTGPDHQPEFRVALLLNNSKISEGKGISKKIAQAKAAKTALNKFIKQDGKRNWILKK